MSRAGRKMELVVDGQIWRAEDYHENTCTEVLIRGPFKYSAFKPDGKPKWDAGHYTCFKLYGQEARCVNRKKSSKNKRGDPPIENLREEVWRKFYDAYGIKRGWF